MAFSHYFTEYNGANFIMLSERLHDLFKFYIFTGRIRAPPELELYEMIPTFQQGAKTDRRALQSKFKSWAKRMYVENDKLKLVNSGKIIIPREQCNDLIMEFHSPEHNSVECIIAKIQHSYTWLRKNFGMDRDMVISILYNSCESEKCQETLRKQLSRSFDMFPCMSPILPTSNLGQSMFMMSNPLAFASPYALNWTQAMPMTPMFSPLGYVSPGLIAPPASLHHSTPKSSRSQPSRNGMPYFWTDPRNVNFNTSQLSQNKLTEHFPKQQSMFKSNVSSNTQANPIRISRGFKRPRNMFAYKKLLKTSRKRPNDYPNILTSEKTKFLSVLELAPKSVCSSKTLRKFDRERKWKKMMTERMKYIVGKALRDRNKLKKNQQNRRSYDRYLKVSNCRNSNLKSSLKGKGESLISPEERNGKSTPISVQNTKYLKIKTVGPKPPEIIEIVSSDDDIKEPKKGPENVKRFQNKETITVYPGVKESKFPTTVNSIKYTFKKENGNTTVDPKSTNTRSYSLGGEFSESNKENACIYDKNNATKLVESRPDTNNFLLKNCVGKSTIFLKDITSTLNHKPQTSEDTFKSQKYVHIRPKDPRYKSFIMPVSDEKNKFSLLTSGFSIPLSKSLDAVNSPTTRPTNFNDSKNSTNIMNQNLLKNPLHNLQPPKTTSLSNPEKDKLKVIQPTLAEQSEQRKKYIVLHSNGRKILLVPPEDHELLQKQLNLQNAVAVGKESTNSVIKANESNEVTSTQSDSSGSAEGRSTIKDETQLKNHQKAEKDPIRNYVNFERSRIARWMQTMNNSFPNVFQFGNEEFLNKLSAQLDVGLSLVKEAKNCLLEREKTENFEDLVSQAISREFNKIIKEKKKSMSR